MIAIWRKILVVIACFLTVGAIASFTAHAQDAADATESASPQVAPDAKPEQAAGSDQAADPKMGACPGMPGGGCCGSCQGKMALGDEASGGGCPCQKARQLQKQQGS